MATGHAVVDDLAPSEVSVIEVADYVRAIQVLQSLREPVNGDRLIEEADRKLRSAMAALNRCVRAYFADGPVFDREAISMTVFQAVLTQLTETTAALDAAAATCKRAALPHAARQAHEAALRGHALLEQF